MLKLPAPFLAAQLSIRIFCYARSTVQVHLEQPSAFAELLAFWDSMGFKPADFMTIGMNEKRAAWLCRVLDRVTHPAYLMRFKSF